MTTQRSDNAVRRLRKVWLGPEGSWRWPFDARYEAWAMACVLTGVYGVAFTFAVPAAVAVAAAAWTTAGKFTATTRGRGGYTAAVLAIGAVATWDPAAWALPLWLPVALAAAPVAAIVTTRTVMRAVTHDRPTRYWIGVIRNQMHAPRPARGPIGVRPVPLVWMPATTHPDDPDAHLRVYEDR